MSGHSHAKTILHKKQITDAKRGKVFSKLSRLISVASKEGDADPKINSRLRLAIEEARSLNMPKENIERAIKRGTGELEDETKLEEIRLEAYGPEGIAIIIEAITDNRKRTMVEIKQILKENKGKLAEEGSVKWLFERKGCIELNNKQQTINKEDLELEIIEAGAEDIRQYGDILNVYIRTKDLEKLKESLENKGIKIESSSLDWVAKEGIQLDEKEKELCEKLFDALDENEAVQDTYSNLKI
ncbi:MAG: YebC/PmpR family DNA-binding transcriptional regulator [Patescibacteria group bacterium]|nr:YebC/PmpR family DNA-binding transcriptional regulator [Patescibacteria group bacterium]